MFKLVEDLEVLPKLAAFERKVTEKRVCALFFFIEQGSDIAFKS